MNKFERMADGIYLLKVPFEDIYTSVFALVEGGKCILLDSACEGDTEVYITPALQKLGVTPDYLIASHYHSDHAGGMAALRTAYPNAIAKAYKDGERQLSRFVILNLKGHTDDCLAIYDEKTRTLISCDCLQAYGIGRYPTLVEDKSAYMQAIKRVRELSPSMIIASHEYEPCGAIMKSKAEIEKFLLACEQAVRGE